MRVRAQIELGDVRFRTVDLALQGQAPRSDRRETSIVPGSPNPRCRTRASARSRCNQGLAGITEREIEAAELGLAWIEEDVIAERLTQLEGDLPHPTPFVPPAEVRGNRAPWRPRRTGPVHPIPAPRPNSREARCRVRLSSAPNSPLGFRLRQSGDTSPGSPSSPRYARVRSMARSRTVRARSSSPNASQTTLSWRPTSKRSRYSSSPNSVPARSHVARECHLDTPARA